MITANAREKERETSKARVSCEAGLAKVSVLECGITISKPDVTFVGQWPRDDPFACNCVSFTTPLDRAVRISCASLLHYIVVLRTNPVECVEEKWFAHADPSLYHVLSLFDSFLFDFSFWFDNVILLAFFLLTMLIMAYLFFYPTSRIVYIYLIY